MADPRTIIVPLTSPGQTATYRLAPGVTQYIQSVVATVDTSASGDVTPVLTISEQSGVVVGDKQQTNPIVGGGSGRATWALGLADETPPSGTAAGFIKYDFDNTGDWLHVSATSHEGITTDGVAFDVTEDFRVAAADVLLNAPGAFGNVLVTSGNTIDLHSAGGINLTGDTGTLNENAVTIQGGATTWQFNIGSGGYTLVSVGDVFIQSSGTNHSVLVQIPTGGTFEVLNHSGSTIFKVDEAGDLHGVTGKTLTFDL